MDVNAEYIIIICNYTGWPHIAAAIWSCIFSLLLNLDLAGLSSAISCRIVSYSGRNERLLNAGRHVAMFRNNGVSS